MQQVFEQLYDLKVGYMQTVAHCITLLHTPRIFTENVLYLHKTISETPCNWQQVAWQTTDLTNKLHWSFKANAMIICMENINIKCELLGSDAFI